MANINEMRREKSGKHNVFILIVGWIFAIMSLIAYPFIFGVIAVVMGIVLTKNGSKAGLPLIVVSIVFMGIGLIFWRTLFNYVTHILGI